MLGGASALIILVMFSMLSLGALRLMSSFADLKLARASAVWVTGYFELEKEANFNLQKTNIALADLFKDGFYGFSLDELRFLEDDGWTIREKDDNFFIYCNVSSGVERAQNLFVELLLSPPDENGQYYRILQWRQWQDSLEREGEGLNIWMG